jgi:hypothetical protein
LDTPNIVAGCFGQHLQMWDRAGVPIGSRIAEPGPMMYMVAQRSTGRLLVAEGRTVKFFSIVD